MLFLENLYPESMDSFWKFLCEASWRSSPWVVIVGFGSVCQNWCHQLLVTYSGIRCGLVFLGKSWRQMWRLAVGILMIFIFNHSSDRFNLNMCLSISVITAVVFWWPNCFAKSRRHWLGFPVKELSPVCLFMLWPETKFNLELINDKKKKKKKCKGEEPCQTHLNAHLS